MIPVHRLTHPHDPVYLNPDVIQAIEAHPDTVVSLTNSTKVVVAETPERIVDLICDWRAEIIARAMERHGSPRPEGVAAD
jgi:flagellar protein FlbD